MEVGKLWIFCKIENRCRIITKFQDKIYKFLKKKYMLPMKKTTIELLARSFQAPIFWLKLIKD